MAFYGDKRTKQDQRDVEDTLSLNRQSQVEQDYKSFFSDECIDVATVIQRKLNMTQHLEARRLACMIFEVFQF